MGDKHEIERQGRAVTFGRVRGRFCYWQGLVDGQEAALVRWYTHPQAAQASTNSTNTTMVGAPVRGGTFLFGLNVECYKIAGTLIISDDNASRHPFQADK